MTRRGGAQGVVGGPRQDARLVLRPRVGHRFATHQLSTRPRPSGRRESAVKDHLRSLAFRLAAARSATWSDEPCPQSAASARRHFTFQPRCVLTSRHGNLGQHQSLSHQLVTAVTLTLEVGSVFGHAAFKAVFSTSSLASSACSCSIRAFRAPMSAWGPSGERAGTGL
jgi:hypothetical protein